MQDMFLLVQLLPWRDIRVLVCALPYLTAKKMGICRVRWMFCRLPSLALQADEGCACWPCFS